MRINNNMMAMNAHRALGINTSNQAKSLEKLSSGLRINRAADDAAGLSISEKMRGQIAGLKQGVRNAQDGISYLQTAEGAMDEVSSMLVRMKELSVQKANGTYNGQDKTNLNLEMTALGSQIDNIINNTEFNGTVISDGTINVFATDSDAAGDATSIGIAVAGQTLGSGSDTATIEASINTINTARSTFGADQNKLESIVNNTNTTIENLQASESRIRDTDMASEMAEFNKYNILLQASTAMLAQANSAPNSVLSLLK